MAEKTDAEKAKAVKAAAAAKKAGLEKQASSKSGPEYEVNADGRDPGAAWERTLGFLRRAL